MNEVIAIDGDQNRGHGQDQQGCLVAQKRNELLEGHHAEHQVDGQPADVVEHIEKSQAADSKPAEGPPARGNKRLPDPWPDSGSQGQQRAP